MWNATGRLAECIAEGIICNNKYVTVKILSSAKSDKNDIVVEVFK
jgi:anaerobic nitric oxide reductase flavorubredoxin